MNANQILRLIRPFMYRRGKYQKWFILAVILLVAYGYFQPWIRQKFVTVSAGEQAIVQAFEQQRSNVMVETDARVIKVLPDDNSGSRHQKMLLELPGSGITLLLAHNIDLAERVPASEGDTIRVHGEYEYSDKGGVVHWTHHDPGGRHEGGWVEFQGNRYE